MDYAKLERLNQIRRKYGLDEWHFPESWKDLPRKEAYERYRAATDGEAATDRQDPPAVRED